jgi:hypothetical protein
MTEIVRCPLRTIALVSLLLGIGLASSPARADQRVGIDSAVNPNAMGIPPGALPRRLVLGQDVVFNERITTEAGGQTQILFVDESTLSVGPNANMVIDQFVYDPNAGTGKFAASLTRGVFRFVGGKLSKQENAVTMRTPTATIGIRGGVMLFDLAEDGKLSVYKVYGKSVTITGLNGVSQTITRNGFAVTVSKPGASPSDPAPPPPGAAAALLAQIDGRAGGNGGATTVPTEVTVANSGIANAISSNVTASIQAAAHTQPPAQQSQNISPVVQLTQLNNQNVSVPGATVTPVGGGSSVPIGGFPMVPAGTPIGGPGGNPPMNPSMPPPMNPSMPPPMNPPMPPMPPVVVIPPPPPPPPITASYAGNFKSTNGFGTTFGLLDPSGTTSNGIAYSGGTLSFPSGAPQNGVFTATLGSAGQLTIPLAPGTATLPANGARTSSPAGPVTGTTYMSPDGKFFYANLTPVNSPAQSEFIYGGQTVNPSFYQATGATRILAFNVQPDAALRSNIPFIRNQAGGNLPNAYVSPYYVVAPANVNFGDNLQGATRTPTLQASLAIDGKGANQQSVIVVQTGQFFTASDGGVAVSGLVRGSSRLDPTAPPIRINSSDATVIDGNGGRIYGGNSIQGFVLDQNGYNFNSNYLPNQLAQENTLVQPQTITTNYAFNQPVKPGTVPTGVGTSRTTQTLTGFFGGLQQNPTAANGVSPPPYIVLGGVTVSTNASTNRVSATLAGGVDPATPSTDGVTAEVLNFGSTSGLYAARSAFVDNSRFAAVESPYNPAATTTSSQGLAPVIINGKVLTFNGDPGQAGLLYLVSSDTVPSTALLPAGVSYCQCQYLQWGYWGGDIRGGTTADNTLRERAHINTWVAGPLTPVTEINALAMQGAAGNYSGHLIGSVFNNGAQYLAAGGLQAAYNFGTQMGSFKVINYDGLNFNQTGKVSVASGPTYGFGIAQPPNGGQPGLVGSVAGAFYGPNATETGGSFAFKKIGLPYYTSGIFAAAGSVPH